jgi:hypothetical protein
MSDFSRFDRRFHLPGQHRIRLDAPGGTVTEAPADLTLLEDLVARAGEAFRGVHDLVFAGDPSANPRLRVEPVEPAWVDGVPTLVLITPWTLNGLMFPLGAGPDELVVATFPRRAYRGDVVPLGVYWSVNLVPDVSQLTSPGQARRLAASFADPFREAVRAWLGGGS